jgi:hypothetical protein
MFSSLKKGLLVAYLASGVWLYVRYEMGTDPLETLLPYAALWVAVGIGGVALALRRPPQPDRRATLNPYEQMWPEERERARAILNARLQGREVATEDSNWLAMLMERYAPLLTQSQQMERFTDYLASVPVKAPAETARPGADASRPEPPRPDAPGDDLHGGPAIVLARALRRPGFDVTKDGTSWFGGLPALGEQSWPTDDLGQPMTPLAQIDLTGLGAHLRLPDLPESGSLAFFATLPEAGDWQGRVVHIRAPGLPTQPLRAPRPVQDHTLGGPLRRGAPEADQRLYPRMALELVRVGTSGLTDRAGFDAEVRAALGPGRDVNLDASLLERTTGAGRPWNRDSLLRFLHGARASLGSGPKAEAELRKTQASYAKRVQDTTAMLAKDSFPVRELVQAQLEKMQSALKQLDATLADLPAATRRLVEELETMEIWARAGDRWAPLTEAEQQILAPLLAPWTTMSTGLGRAHLDKTTSVHRRMADCVRETLLVMAVAPDRDFATLPEPARAAIQGPWRQPYDRGHHQMFGCPDSIQSAADDNAHALLLLQLQCDDLAGFHWGDAGVLQYWIRPADLKAGRWDRAYMTFEGN